MARDTYLMGAWTDARTAAQLREAQRLLNAYGIYLLLTQGSYNKGVVASAGTHDGGGCVDINVSGMSLSQMQTVVRVLRSVGLAAWIRTPAQGFSLHIHAVSIGCPDLAWLAAQQVTAYRLGYNGLGNAGMGGKDDGPRQYVNVTWETYTGGSAYRPPINTDGGNTSGGDATSEEDALTPELAARLNQIVEWEAGNQRTVMARLNQIVEWEDGNNKALYARLAQIVDYFDKKVDQRTNDLAKWTRADAEALRQQLAAIKAEIDGARSLSAPESPDLEAAPVD